ncbi:MAG: TIGR04282 family arsenosugar biosynthesis glycosyltransferase [Pseudomonadales bacterium]|nr:TIGR04282 family arsenosugar biosynthesis glycosyltransferase [Pseudomonadales bacterium]
MTELRVLVFARAPEPGRVKTRLIPALGADGAAALYLDLLDHVLAEVAVPRGLAVELWVDRAPASPELRARADAMGAALRVQAEGDLGRRMDHALRRVLAEGALPILVGSDLPGLRAAHLEAAARALQEDAEAVFAPASDGGYGLVGLKRPMPELFADMPWSTPAVMDETAARLAAAGVRWTRLDALWDVDGPEDLARLATLPGFRARLTALGWRGDEAAAQQ